LRLGEIRGGTVQICTGDEDDEFSAQLLRACDRLP
jgi:hypothetical protein